ncbi:GGDEF domain-containing protein [Deinococcus sp. Arct2-2]|uniref:GGDEF domain-containing protein n=1 Tax=Deinococcus sp. Arct2-2 TaxID=2568653 RepID=UPI0010A4A0BA|nr:GGDEF domain-containing protein [Deinococcus sp. Arct2-2]THF67926.1 GGDEF domain-containing protein [Deinococcus sp. Arct2-2]
MLRIATAWHRPQTGAAFLSEIHTLGQERHGLTWQPLTETAPLFIDQYAEHARALPRWVDLGLQAAAWLPLGDYEGARYLLLVTRLDQAQAWQDGDRALMQAAEQLIQQALDRQTRLQQIKQVASLDPLTQLGNRWAFDAALLQLDSTGQDFAALMLDIDGLKRLNDREGHARGDQLLATFGQLLKREFRLSDEMYRVGGDEVVILLRQPHLPGTAELERRLHAVLSALKAAEFTDIDISVGGAQRGSRAVSAATVIEEADAQMYRVKRQHHGDRSGGHPTQLERRLS